MAFAFPPIIWSNYRRYLVKCPGYTILIKKKTRLDIENLSKNYLRFRYLTCGSTKSQKQCDKKLIIACDFIYKKANFPLFCFLSLTHSLDLRQSINASVRKESCLCFCNKLLTIFKQVCCGRCYTTRVTS